MVEGRCTVPRCFTIREAITIFLCRSLYLNISSKLRLLVAQAAGGGAGLSEVVFTGSGDASNVEVTLTNDLTSATFDDAIVELT